MSLITKGTVENVEGSYIETYLNKMGYKRKEDEKGISTVDWVNNLLATSDFDEALFGEFLFQELFLGKRKLIRIYELDSVSKIKYIEDWKQTLIDVYKVEDLYFNDILNVSVNSSDKYKIAAIHYSENGKGELARLQILFVCYIQLGDDMGYRDSCAYIPVDIDFVKRVMSIKAWNRNGVVEKDRANDLIDHIKDNLAILFKVLTRNYMVKHKKVLYRMSKGMVEDVYNKIPAFNQIGMFQSYIDEFEQTVFAQLDMINVSESGNKKKIIPKGVMEFSDEIRKAIERLAISDYFFDRSYEEIWNMGIDVIISKIKFNDNENILASLSGEDSEKPIFCTKTFMYLKKSMEDSKLVERLWVVKNRNKGRISVRYDATNEEYLEILIRNGIRYTEDDLIVALEIYENYEAGITKEITNNY